MEKIKIGTKDTSFKIESIQPISKNIIEIVFAGLVPEVYGDILVYNEGGFLCSTLYGYSTVYRDEGLTVYLSNNGSVYTTPEISPGNPPEPYKPTIDEVRKSKLYSISSVCYSKIVSGFDVTLSGDVVEHFALSETDQINLQTAMATVQQGAESYPYHADCELCRLYSAADIIAIGSAAMDHKFFHTTYCNHLNTWLRRADSIEEIETIQYGVELPADLAENMAVIMTAVCGGQNEATE